MKKVKKKARKNKNKNFPYKWVILFLFVLSLFIIYWVLSFEHEESQIDTQSTNENPSYSKSYEETVKAYRSRRYKSALEGFKYFAEQGDSSAQNWVGIMYLNGEGTPPNYEEAEKWLRKSAEQCDPYGHNTYGNLYKSRGEASQAYIQYFLAASLTTYEDISYEGDSIKRVAEKSMEEVGVRLTPENRKLAEEKAKEWKEEYCQ